MMAVSIRTSCLIAALVALAGCATAVEKTADEPRKNVVPPRNERQLGAVSARERELRELILAQVTPCMRSELEKIDDPKPVGPMLLVFGFEADGSASSVVPSEDTLQRYETDPAYREVANAIMLGVAECSPLKDMPKAEYDTWSFFPLYFGPRST